MNQSPGHGGAGLVTPGPIPYAAAVPGHQLSQHEANLGAPFKPGVYVSTACTCAWASEWTPALNSWLAFNAGQQHLADHLTEQGESAP